MKKLFTVFLIIFSCSVFSQKFELGKVSVEELKERVHPLDSSAPAAILYKKGSTRFEIEGVNWIIVTEVEIKLKIYAVEGFSYGQVTVPYNIEVGYNEKVEFSDMVTYSLSGNKIVKTKLANTAQISEGKSDKVKVRKILLPNISEGCIIEYKYILKSGNLSIIPEWYFQSMIPINRIEYNVSIPNKFSYNKTLDSSFPIKETEKNQKRIIQLQHKKLNCDEVSRLYAVNNVPAFKGIEADNDSKLASLKFELAETLGLTDIDKVRPVNWDRIAGNIYESDYFGKQLEKTTYFEKDINEQLKDVVLRDSIISTIFNYVKGRMRWNEYLGYRCDGSIEDAYAAKTGNTGEINLMLIAMLRYAGLNAYPVVLSTRNSKHANAFGRASFNYVLAGVESPNKIILLDATNKNSTPGILPVWRLSDVGRLMRTDLTSRDVSLTPTTSSLENTLVIAKIESDGMLTGKVKVNKYNYNGLLFRDVNPGINSAPHIKEEYVGTKEKALDNIEITSLEVTNEDKATKPLVESFDFKSKDLCEIIDGKIYISPMLMYSMTQNPFLEEERSDPLKFYFPYQDKYVISITIPEGYMVESYPQSAHLVLGDNMGSFKFNVAINQGNQIQVLMTNDINVISINPEYYESLKAYTADMVKKQTEKIVLVKK
mgnify:CR=1 FL=1